MAGDIGQETERLSYRELGERLGISPGSARARAKRRAARGEWRIIPGNHPLDRVMVELPAAELVAKPARRPRSPRGAEGEDGRLVDHLVRQSDAQRQRLDYLTDLLFEAKDVLISAQAKLAAREAEMARVRAAAAAENRAAGAAILAAKEETLRAKQAHLRDASELAAAEMREMGTKAELERAQLDIQALRRAVERARRRGWRRWLP